MVLVDGVKYACQACIKGHRSSKCTHTTRELTEIKKKGRPTSQCNHCRQLRKTRSVHGKCECVGGQADREQTPAAKVLPNGLIDIMTPMIPSTSSSSTTETLKSGVTRLLNPCNCKNGGDCTCCQVVSKSKSKPFPTSSTPSSPIFVSTCLPSPPSPPLPSMQSISCCSSKPSTSHTQPPPIPSTSSCCTPSTSQGLPTSSSCFAPSFPSPSLQSSSSSLFLPATHGTSSCFCGPTCQCAGCATHDPFGLKVKRKRSDSLDGDGGGEMGCQCEKKEGKKKQKKKRECCEPKEEKVEWPELRWDATTRERSLSRTGTEGGESLPSLRSLLPALSLDSTTPDDIQVDNSNYYPSLTHDPLLYPPEPSHPQTPPTDPSQVKIACSSAYLAPELFDQEENKGHDGDCGDFCACDDLCGCKGTQSTKGEEGLKEVARLAEMGYFG